MLMKLRRRVGLVGTGMVVGELREKALRGNDNFDDWPSSIANALERCVVRVKVDAVRCESCRETTSGGGGGGGGGGSGGMGNSAEGRVLQRKGECRNGTSAEERSGGRLGGSSEMGSTISGRIERVEYIDAEREEGAEAKEVEQEETCSAMVGSPSGVFGGVGSGVEGGGLARGSDSIERRLCRELMESRR
jgi:hypothetical protein